MTRLAWPRRVCQPQSQQAGDPLCQMALRRHSHPRQHPWHQRRPVVKDRVKRHPELTPWRHEELTPDAVL
jgi:hypothetical protein